MNSADEARSDPALIEQQQHRGRFLARAAGSATMAVLGCYAALSGYRLGLFQLGAPDAGLFPFMFGTALVVAAAVSLAIDLRGLSRALPSCAGAGGERSKVGGYFATLAVYLAALPVLGFLVATGIALAGLLRFVERYGWRASLGTAVGASLAMHYLFVRLLAVPLPKGWW
ncbi:MAG: tripartite tricarboxylate transporter TctB family protein [Burkholderiales bacterium]|nr:tripartite tricarboxylate transporter TctB family protein [Burkholderiales bacterium]